MAKPKSTKAAQTVAASWGTLGDYLKEQRLASRLSLRITGIRVERVQSISEADAIAEGMAHYWREMDDKAARKVEHRWDAAARAHGYEKTPPDYRGLYAVLWDAINGKRAPFASNPWTWVIDVERVPRG